jgi:lipopolysaccharide export system protein LptA
LSTSIVSTNTTLSTDNQLVVTSGTITVKLPASPLNGQIVYLYMDATGTTLDPNGNPIRITGVDTLTPITLSGVTAAVRVIYASGTWYVL